MPRLTPEPPPPPTRPLTPERIVDAALDLSAERGLDGWTLRELATILGTWPNTVTYHVGGREAVVSAVLERIVALMPIPPDDLPWQDWFRQFLTAGRAVVRRYPGAARRLCRDGPTVPSALPIIDRGVGLLVDAGFGHDAPRAYAILLNGALLLVALEEERVTAGRARHQAAEDLLAMPPPPGAGPGWTAMGAYLTEWTTDPEAASDRLYAYTVEHLIAGLHSDVAGAR